MSNLSISVVICTYNRYECIETCIKSVLKQSLPDDMYEVIIVDNTPKNLINEDIVVNLRAMDRVLYIYESVPGLSNARNVGASVASNNIITYIDDDAIADYNWLKNIVAAYEFFGDKAAIVGGKISPIWPVPRPHWVHDQLLPSLTVIDWGGQLRISKPHEWFAGANISFKKSYLNQVGGFSTSLGRVGISNALLSNEETDVINAIKNIAGLQIYSPLAEVSHLVDERRLNKTWFRRRAAWQAVSDYIMDQASSKAYGKRSLEDVLAYLATMPPQERNISGLYKNKEDPNSVLHQVNSVYSLVISALSGFDNDEEV